jgi:hypothetical protein
VIRLDQGFLSRELPKLSGYRGVDVADTAGAAGVWIALLTGQCVLAGGPEATRDLCPRGQTIDWLLRLTQKRHRDHYQHQWQVVALGAFLLSLDVGEGARVWQCVARAIESADGLDSPPTREAVRAAWILAGALHDHAYPVEHILRSARWCDDLADCGERDAAIGGMRHILEAVQHIYAEPLRDLVDKPASHGDRLEQSCELVRRNLVRYFVPPVLSEAELQNLAGAHDALLGHGLCSAVNLFLNMKGAGLNPRLVTLEEGRAQLACLRHALRAMALHDAPGSMLVCSDTDPLGFLLLLCDEMQDWDRRVLVDEGLVDEQGEVWVEGVYPTADNWWRLGNELDIMYFYPDKARLDASRWNIDLASAGKRRAFSRLRNRGGWGPQAIRFGLNLYHTIPLGE